LPVFTKEGTSGGWRLDVRDFARKRSDQSWEEIKTAYRNEIGGALQRWRNVSSARGMDYRTHFALQLQSLSYDADFVLDLHTGDTAPLYLYAPEYALKSAIYFGIPHVLAMGYDFGGSFDEVNYYPWLLLQKELASLGRNIDLDVEAYTVELGSLVTIQPDAMERDGNRILNYLQHKGLVSGEPSKPSETIYCSNISDYLAYCSPASGLAVIHHPPGSKFVSGQQIGYILTMRNFQNIERPEEAQTPLRVNEDGILITRRLSPIVFEGEVLFKLMTRYRILSE